MIPLVVRHIPSAVIVIPWRVEWSPLDVSEPVEAHPDEMQGSDCRSDCFSMRAEEDGSISVKVDATKVYEESAKIRGRQSRDHTVLEKSRHVRTETGVHDDRIDSP